MKKDDFSSEMMMADALLRIKAVENLLMAKGIFTQDEFTDEMAVIASKIAKTILQKANVPGDLDELIKNLQGPKKIIEDN